MVVTFPTGRGNMALIRVKRIYNFWSCHVWFSSLLHVYGTLLHHFEAFYWTNLLTRCPVLVSCFCDVFVAKSYFWKYSRNWTKIYEDFLLDKWRPEPKGRPREQPSSPQARGDLWSRPRVHPWVGPAPGLWVPPGVALLAPFLICPIKNPRKFSSNSENILRSNFLKQKHHKNRELSLGTLSIG